MSMLSLPIKNKFLDYLQNINIPFTIGGQYGLVLYKVKNIRIRWFEIIIDLSFINMFDELDIVTDKKMIILSDASYPVLVEFKDIKNLNIKKIDHNLYLNSEYECIRSSIDNERFAVILDYAKESKKEKSLDIIYMLLSYSPKDVNTISFFNNIKDNSKKCEKIQSLIDFYSQKNIISAKIPFYPDITTRDDNESVLYCIENGFLTLDKKNNHKNIDFVIDHNNDLIMGIGHSFLANNAGFVLGVGTINIKKNKNIVITNFSGHYRPTEKDMKYAINYFKTKFKNKIIYENIQI